MRQNRKPQHHVHGSALQKQEACVREQLYLLNKPLLHLLNRQSGWVGPAVNSKEEGRGKSKKCFSYHTGYKESRAAPRELCSSPELEWWPGRSQEEHSLEWWAEEEPVEHTGLLGASRSCSLLEINTVPTFEKTRCE